MKRNTLTNYFKAGIGFIISLSIASKTFSQVDPVGDFNRHVAESWKGEFIRIGTYKVKGSPYLLGEAFPGSILYKDGRITSNTKILYDLYNQKAGMDVDNKIFEADVPIESFDIDLGEKYGGKKLLFKNSSVFGKPEMKCYLNVLEDGPKVALLKAYKTKLFPDPTNTMDKDMKVFAQVYEYYLYDKNSKTLTNIKLRKKDIVKDIVNEEFVKSYLATNDVDFNKEQDVMNLLKSYNKL